MAISRMNMERQMRNMGGIMTLDDPRQGYFLGKLVKKITKPIKKVVKSPLGKAALLGAAANFAPMLFGKQTLLQQGGGLTGILDKIRGGEGFLGQLGNVFRQGGKKDNPFSIFRLAGGAAGLGALAAPFLMGGDEEVIDEGVDVSGIQPMVADIRRQAREYYQDPTRSALYFMPPKSAVQSSFYAADGGLANIPREGYRIGGGVRGMLDKAGQMMKTGIGKVKSLFDDADINISVRDEDVMTDAGLQAQATGLDVFVTPKSTKATKVMDNLIEEGYDIAKAEDGTYAISSLDEGALDLIAKRLRLGGKDIDEFMANFDDLYSSSDEKMIADALRNRKANGGIMMASNIENDRTLENLLEKYLDMGLSPAEAEKAAREEFERMTKQPAADRTAAAEGGLMDLGGMEKDYREGGFVPIGAKERADDVPARLSKNEFVFTADAVRNAGGGDIDKGAEVMQNMMDNLEAGGTISEESQGMENPAQAMFDQAQMLEGRLT